MCENLAGSLVIEGHSDVVVVTETVVEVSDCIAHASHIHMHIGILVSVNNTTHKTCSHIIIIIISPLKSGVYYMHAQIRVPISQ